MNLIAHSTGDVTERYQYSAFGEEQIFDKEGKLIQDSELGNPWRFSSKRVDETKLIYFGRRYYEPALGRWLTPDPLGYEGGPNLYAYVSNNPLSHFDLYGLLDEVKGEEKGVWERTRDCVKSVLSAIGNGIEHIGHNYVPIPGVRTVVSACGTMIAGRNLSSNPTLNETSSDNFTVGKQRYLVDHLGIVLINGLRTSPAEALSRAETTSQNVMDQYIEVTYLADCGAVMGAGLAVLEIWGYSTEACEKLLANVRNELERVGPDGRVILGAHSRGGATVGTMLPHLTPEQRAQIEVYTFGSAQIIDRKTFGLARAQNFISTRDPIPFICDPIGIAKDYFGNRGCVTFVKCVSESWLFDHSMDDKTYRTALNVVEKDVCKRYNRY